MTTIAICAWAMISTPEIPAKPERRRGRQCRSLDESDRATSWLSAADASDARVSTKMPSVPDPEQAYYWSEAWQLAEREAEREIANGGGKTFASASEAIRWLESDE